MFGFHFCKITGVGMTPYIPENSFVFLVPWLRLRPLKEGNILKVFHPRYGVIVRTLAKVDHNGLLWLKAWQENNLPIEKLGPVSKEHVLGKVLMVISPRR
ncbi:nickel-type superoxide dismutase maturation protease [Colwellia sp. RSH04]|uniref:nickel-type superoxide dismutase maturation protease n=1 Tax=Colwellia sp. RSH04 TaxID=2305464 RepID=UPI000E59206B|nr:nickel-type superoxide dismutase maturation protease [Colwellia sp. RSH04]RHW77943.1 nickel-type superoxide dismutase maturation protease [Colwellia sp. RSH04]